MSPGSTSRAAATIRPVTPAPEAPRRLFLLDGHSLATARSSRCRRPSRRASGTVTNAVYGFTSMLIKLLAEEHPDLIAVAFDSGAPTLRLEKDADYKAGRPETPGDFKPQLGLIEEVLDSLQIPVLRVADGHEADDAIGTLAVEARRQGIDATIVTADRDFFQLVRPGITVMFNRKGISDIVRYDEAAVTERFGITPAAVPRLRGPQGRHERQHPGRARRGRQDRGQARAASSAPSRSCSTRVDELKGKLKENVDGLGRPARAEQGARPDRDRRRAPGGARGLRDGRVGRRRGPPPVHLARVPEPLRPAPGRRPRGEAEGRRGRARPPRDRGRRARRRCSARAPPRACGSSSTSGRARGSRSRRAAPRPRSRRCASIEPVAGFLGDAAAPKWAHDAKALERAASAEGVDAAGVTFDTMLAGYLLDPAAADYPLRRLCEAAPRAPTCSARSRTRPRGSCSARRPGGPRRPRRRPSRCSRR